MARFQPGRCVHCGRPFQKWQAGQRQPKRLNPTIDHLYPTNAELPAGLKTWGDPLNQFRSCYDCNQKKGNSHPIRWLTIMESDECATALSEIMLALGEDPFKVGFAMGSRTRETRI